MGIEGLIRRECRYNGISETFFGKLDKKSELFEKLMRNRIEVIFAGHLNFESTLERFVTWVNDEINTTNIVCLFYTETKTDVFGKTCSVYFENAIVAKHIQQLIQKMTLNNV